MYIMGDGVLWGLTTCKLKCQEKLLLFALNDLLFFSLTCVCLPFTIPCAIDAWRVQGWQKPLGSSYDEARYEIGPIALR